MEKEVYLYRLKLLTSPQLQLPLMGEVIARSEIINKSLKEKFNNPSKVDKDWKIGNLVYWDAGRGYFFLGRQGSLKQGQFDEENKKYEKQSIVDYPYTTVLFNSELQLIAIVKNSKLGIIDSIARKLQMILSTSSFIKELDLAVQIHPIPDPNDLLNQIRGAYKVTRFMMRFTKPNPSDISELFHKDAESLVAATKADIGTTTLKGDDLARDPLCELTKSFASSGNYVEAMIKYDRDDKPVKKTLGKQPYAFTQNEDLVTEEETLIIAEQEYRQIRYENEDK